MDGTLSVAEDPLSAARALLQPGEDLVWADRPGADALARAKLPQVIRGVLGLAVIAGFLWLSFIPHWPGGLGGLLLALLLAAAVLYCLWLLAAPLVARQVVPGEGGRGAVVFVNRKKPWWWRSAGGSYQMEVFFGIAEAERVGELIAELKADALEAQSIRGNGR